MAGRDEKTVEGQVRSTNVELAIDIVRAAGGEVSQTAIEIAERAERGEIDNAEAVRLIRQLHSGG